MKTKTIKLYSFEELEKSVQEKVLNNFRNNNEYYFLGEDLNNYLVDLLKENKIDGEGKVYYSLSYCQGDGAMFEGNFTWKGYNVKVKQSGRYYHYNSKDISITDDEYNDVEEQLYLDFNTLYVSICKKLEDAGYKYIESEDSEENIKDNIEVNEYLFTEDGRIETL